MSFDSLGFEAHLLPEALRTRLARAAALISAADITYRLVVSTPRSFLSVDVDFDEKLRPLRSAQYLDHLDLPADATELAETQRCLAWCVENDALSADDAAPLLAMWAAAEGVASELEGVVFGSGTADPLLLRAVLPAVEAIERYWARLDMDITGDFDSEEIDDDAIGTPVAEAVGLLYAAVVNA
jgi:hypothetical protein